MVGLSSLKSVEARANPGDRLHCCTDLGAESVGFQPDGQLDAERTYKHLRKLAAPVSTCKLLKNQ